MSDLTTQQISRLVGAVAVLCLIIDVVLLARVQPLLTGLGAIEALVAAVAFGLGK